MSGSPVYIDGKLLGAVALGFPFSKEAIAGIQPIESMLRDATFFGEGKKAALRARVPIAAGELANLPVPVSFSGFSESALAAYTPRFTELGFRLQPGLAQKARTFPR